MGGHCSCSPILESGGGRKQGQGLGLPVGILQAPEQILLKM